MQVDLDKLAITHNQANHAFEVWIDGKLSKLDYIRMGRILSSRMSVFIPRTQRAGRRGENRGSGSAICQRKFLRVIPMCSYAAAYIRRNPHIYGVDKPGTKRMTQGDCLPFGDPRRPSVHCADAGGR